MNLATFIVTQAGHDLSIKDSCGTSDPYVKFFHDGKMVHKSKTVYKDLNPFWDEKFELIIEDTSVPLDLKVSTITRETSRLSAVSRFMIMIGASGTTSWAGPRSS